MATTIDPQVVQEPAAQGSRLTSLPSRILASNGGAWFAWGFIGGLMFAGAAVYVIRKKL